MALHLPDRAARTRGNADVLSRDLAQVSVMPVLVGEHLLLRHDVVQKEFKEDTRPI